MLNKKLSKTFLLGAAVLMMASCGDIIAKPERLENDKTILDKIDFENKGSDMNNLYETIYNAMHDSSALSTTTVNILNTKIFEKYFGSYDEIKAAYEDGTGAKATELIGKTLAYKQPEDEKEGLDDAAIKKLEIARIKRTYETIQSLISEKLYTALSSSDYQDINGKFSEKLFALGVYKKLHSLDATATKWSDFIKEYKFYEPTLLIPNTKLFDKESAHPVWEDHNIIHISSKQKADGTLVEENFGYYKDYVMNEILPTVYEHVLSEYYLYTKEYSSLGGKYARKATYISIAPNSKDIYKQKHADLVDAFARINVLNGDELEAGLDNLEGAWIGLGVDDIEKQLLLDASFTPVTIEVTPEALPGLRSTETAKEFAEEFENILDLEVSGDVYNLTYYEGTLFGNVMEDFLEIDPFNIENSSKAQESKFSGNNTYSYYDGLVKEINTLRQKKLIVEGWGLKADGFTGLDANIKERLMSINVATDLKKPEEGETYRSNYLSYAPNSGNFYLLPEKRMPEDKTPFVLSSSTTKYIVQVEEAASVAKLSKKSTIQAYDLETREAIAYEICDILADNSSVKTDAMKFFLEESEILYHDDQILKYFKENYPSLFED